MAHVEIEIEDYLDEVSTKVLVRELKSRSDAPGVPKQDPDFCIPVNSAIDTLDETSRIMRKMGRVDLAYKLDEVRVDYFDKPVKGGMLS